MQLEYKYNALDFIAPPLLLILRFVYTLRVLSNRLCFLVFIAQHIILLDLVDWVLEATVSFSSLLLHQC